MIVDFISTFAQNNKGDTKGTIWATKNIDPELNPGEINISKQFGYSTNETDQSNMTEAPVAFTFSAVDGSARYFGIIGTRVWRTSSDDPNGPWTVATGSGTGSTVDSDIIAFNAKIYLADSSGLQARDSLSFSNLQALSDTPHSMCIYANRLYVTDALFKIYSMNTAETVATTGSNTMNLNTLTGLNQVITKIQPVSDGIWIATLFTDSTGGEMIKWDGVTANIASERYRLKRGALSMCIKDDRPYIIDSLGIFRAFDGTTFAEVGRLPILDETLENYNNDSNDRWIHPNGMIEVNDEIYVLAKNTLEDSGEDPIERFPSGIWAYNKNYGVYHKYSFADIDVADATPVVKDFGASELADVGALFKSDFTGGSTVARADESEVLAGVTYYSDATTEKSAVGITNVINDIQKGGYFVTAQLTSENFEETWKEIIVVHDRLANSTDRIILKYRTYESTPIYGTGTWTEDTRFISGTDLSSFEGGDEIEILRGTGSGECLTVDHVSGATIIHLKENFLSGMTGTLRFRAQKWKDVGIQSNQDIQFIRRTLGEKGAWIQFKVFMVGTGKSPQLLKLICASTPAEKTK